MTAHTDPLRSALTAWRHTDDPWADGHAAAILTATMILKVGVARLAEHGNADAIRVHDALRAADGVHDIRLVVNAELVRLEADSNPPQPTDETAWCPTCRRRRVVDEIDPTCSRYVGNDEMEWTATRLSCGHVLEGEERRVGASPGGEAAAEALAQDATRRRLDRAAAMQDVGW